MRANASRAEDAARLVGQRQVHGEEVRDAVDLLRRLRRVDAELAEAVDRDERVVRHDAHPQPERATGDELADAPEPEHAERLVGELDAAPARPLPAPLLQRRVGLRDVARQRDEQPDRVLGGRDDVRLRRVRDDDAAPRRRLHVDVVDADARATDHAQTLAALDQLGGERRRRADHDRVVAADDLGEIRVAVDVDLEPGAQQLDASRRDLLPESGPLTRARAARRRSARR